VAIDMAVPAASTPESRLAELERQVLDLKARIAALERMVTNPGEHPADQSTVRRKVTYDWQS
jgi:hypothetical protein